MTTLLRRLLAARIAAKTNRALRTTQACTWTVPTLGLFGDAPKQHVRSVDRIQKFQDRLNRRLVNPRARAAVSRNGSQLKVYATTHHE